MIAPKVVQSQLFVSTSSSGVMCLTEDGGTLTFCMPLLQWGAIATFSILVVHESTIPTWEKYFPFSKTTKSPSIKVNGSWWSYWFILRVENVLRVWCVNEERNKLFHVYYQKTGKIDYVAPNAEFFCYFLFIINIHTIFYENSS